MLLLQIIFKCRHGLISPRGGHLSHKDTRREGHGTAAAECHTAGQLPTAGEPGGDQTGKCNSCPQGALCEEMLWLGDILGDMIPRGRNSDSLDSQIYAQARTVGPIEQDGILLQIEFHAWIQNSAAPPQDGGYGGDGAGQYIGPLCVRAHGSNAERAMGVGRRGETFPGDPGGSARVRAGRRQSNVRTRKRRSLCEPSGQ